LDEFENKLIWPSRFLAILFTPSDVCADKRCSSAASTSATMTAFSLLVTLEFTAEEHKETFLKDISPLAKYVEANEPDTIAYKVLFSDKDPLRVLIMERYKEKESAFLKVHRTSEPFLEFRPKLQALQDAGFVNVVGESFIDSDLGFGDRVKRN
jgi:quinol monooxygenase YgiN